MSMVDRLVHKTNVLLRFPLEYLVSLSVSVLENVSLMFFLHMVLHHIQEKIESATDVLKAILKHVIDEVEEISWPPRDPAAISLMERVCFLLLV